MPPEPLPWDRRDLIFREKKHERGAPYGDALGSGGSSSTSRWRESCHNPRDFPGHPLRRSQSGYNRHHAGGNGYHDLSGEDPCSRSEDSGFRTYQSGRYGGGGCRNNNNREAGGFFRRSSWDSSDLSRQNPKSVASQGSAAESLSHPSSHNLLKDDEQDAARGDVDPDLKTSHIQDRDLDHTLGSLSWKPLKWNRSGSFSSSSKVLKTESEEKKLEILLPPGKETPVESPVSSPLSPDEGFSRRKQRLGWGQGLAKYERSRTEISDEVCLRHLSQSDDASPRIVGLPGSTSPATPASLTCSSSHGGEDKAFSEAANSDAATNLGDAIRHFLDELSISSEYLDLNSPNGSTSKFGCLLETDGGSPGDSSLRKLLLVKDRVLKQLEKTESDIDSFENELKKLNSDKLQTMSKLGANSKKNEILSDQSNSFQEQAGASPKPLSKSSQHHEGDNVSGGFSPAAVESSFRESLPVEKESLPVEVLQRDGSSSISDFGEEFLSIASSIIASNQEHVKKASCVLDATVPVDSPAFQTSESYDNFSDQEKELLMKKMIGVRKYNLKFKEQVLALKYRVFLHLWKEDVQMLQIKKQRSRSHRKIELSRSSQHVVQKSRSILRSRFPPLHGGSTSVPTPEILEFTGRLLSDSHCRVYRSVLRMPSLILDEKEKTRSRFLTNNGLVEDPCSLEKERSLTNPWSPEERSVFIEMLSLYGKNFSKISSFLDHKTAADCVEFYYKNHKSEDFRKAKKKAKDLVPAGNFLGSASSSSKWKRQVVPRQPYPAEQETSAADVLVGIMAVTERRLPFSTAEGGSEDIWSEDGSEDLCSGDWTDEEKSSFIAALTSHGRDFAVISRCVGSRSAEQCKIFFSKARKSLALDEILTRASAVDDVDSATCAKPEEELNEAGASSLQKRPHSAAEEELAEREEAKKRRTSPPPDWPELLRGVKEAEQSVKLFGKILSQPPNSPEKSASTFLGPPSCGFTAAADGGAAIVLGGKSCSNGGISDPVGAMKLHYAARAGVLSREDESWRADVGR